MYMKFWNTTIATATILVTGQFVACTTDSTGGNTADTGGSANAAGSSSVPGDTGGSAGGGTTSTSTAVKGTCAAPSKPVTATIATFDSCTVGAITDAVPCGLGILAGTKLTGGTFQYNDGTGNPVFQVIAGHAGNALQLVSTDPASGYGGGFGIWTSGCFNASSYTGITFWARGIGPNGGNAMVKLQVAETTPMTTALSGNKNTGTCSGDMNTCKPPSLSFPLTDTWTQIHASWANFDPGDANGTPVQPNGNNLYQIQWEAGLLFSPSAADPNTYVAEPAPYDLQIDDVAFE